MTLKIENIYPQGSWRGRRCFVVGGGPSLADFDWSRLNGELTIAINSSMHGRARSVINISSDYRWQNSIVSTPDRLTGALDGCAELVFHDLGPIKGLKRTPREGPTLLVGSAGRRVWSEDLSKGLIHATHSGASALNLAYLLGANPIYLLGFDYLPGDDGKTTHHHDYYPEEWKDGAYSSYGTFSREIHKLAEENLKGRRQVYNATKEGMSALSCFPKMLIDDVSPPARRPTYTTAFTEDYRGTYVGAARSFARFGIELNGWNYADRGSWRENVAQKPRILQAALEENDEVVWVDADARLKRYPSLFDNLSADVGVHWLTRNRRRPPQACPGTVYLRGDAGRQFVGWWVDALETHPDEVYGDIAAFVEAWRRAKEAGMRLLDLDPEYCWIYDTMPRLHPGKTPVIEHLQASREKR